MLVGLLFLSCNDFLEQYPKDQVYASSAEDLNELLVGEAYILYASKDLGEWFHLMDDDASYYRAEALYWEPLCEFFWWGSNPSTATTWAALYKRIGAVNAVLDEIDAFSNEAIYRKVKGEAYFLRGAYYHFLVNLYGKPYQKGSATTDLGVPLKLEGRVDDKYYSRHSIQECYDQIVSDLNNAITYLKGETPKNVFRASEMAARHLLGRVYLYMGDWENAEKECSIVIASNDYQLLDFNTLPATLAQANAVATTSPETIFTGGGRSWSSGNFGQLAVPRFHASRNLIESYKPGDKRRTYFFRGGNTPTITPNEHCVMKLGTTSDHCSDFFLFRLPETYLNRAEALTALGKEAEAIRDLQHLRQMRYTPEVLDNVNLSGEVLMNFIRNERRLEFVFEGHRWFDLRRYAVSPTYPYQQEIKHNFYNQTIFIENGLVLKKYDEEPEYYVLPLPENEVVINGGLLKQNAPKKSKYEL